MKPETNEELEQEEAETFWDGFVQGLKESPRLYFAPLVLLYKAIRAGLKYIAGQFQRSGIAKGRVHESS